MARKSESLISSASAASAAFFCATCICCSLSTFVIEVSDIDHLLYKAPVSPAFCWSRSYTSRYPAVSYRTLRRERLPLGSPLALELSLCSLAPLVCDNLTGCDLWPVRE